MHRCDRSPKTASPIRRGAVTVATISAFAVGAGLASSARAQQQAPPVGTNLGTLVVTPAASTAISITPLHTKIERHSLKLNLQPGTPASRATPASTSASPLPASAVRTPPRARHLVPPQYPSDDIAQSLRGSVTVGFVIGRDGHTGNIRIVSSTPPGVFDQAALQAVREWRFEPATVNGVAVPTNANETLIFNPPLQKQTAPSPPPRPAPAKPLPAEPPVSATHPDNAKASLNIQPLRIVPPQYPPHAWREGIGGSVTVQFTVGSDGKPTQLQVLEAHPRNIFNEAALRAVRQWRFRPVPTPTRVVQIIHFTPP